MSKHFAITLTPNEWDRRSHAHTLGEREWSLAVTLVDRAGFRPNLVGGVSARDVGPFASHLARALQQARVSEADRSTLDGLLDFLTRKAGGRGLTLTRGWKKWNQA
ncbi:MAG: hypothetical protein U0804_12620 [Gemmataceae bacterium]